MFLSISTTPRKDRSYSQRLTALENHEFHLLNRYPDQKTTRRAVASLDFPKILAEMEREVLKEAGICPALREFRKMEHQRTQKSEIESFDIPLEACSCAICSSQEGL